MKTERRQIAERQNQEVQADADRRIQDMQGRIPQIEDLLLEHNQEIHRRLAEAQDRNSAIAEEITLLRGEYQDTPIRQEQMLFERSEIHTHLTHAQSVEESLHGEINVLRQMIQVLEED